MEGIVLTAFINFLVDGGLLLILNKLQELKSGLEPQLDDLKDNLSIIQTILGDAEERQLKEKPLRVWLDQLRTVAYDANDLLDECATEVLRHQVISMQEVRKFLSEVNPSRFMFKQGISHRLKEILENLGKIVKRGHDFNLIRRTEVAGSVLDQTTSLPPSSIVGRDNDKKKLVQLLVKSPRETGLSVIPVLGMSGIGKTALAQYVYNDDAVAKHFKLKFWVHVSYDLNMKKITNAMAESVNSQIISLTNLDSVQNLLCRRLRNRAYLLVLDGVCNVDSHEWEKLKPLLLYGAKGSRILVTTTSQEVAKFMGTMPPHHLQGLLDDDCLSLFCQHALGTNHCDVDDVARKVVDKCKGLPFMAQLIGFRLRKESDRSKWGAILRDEMWDFSGGEGNILCSLRFNYGQFPAHLKACFAYCSIFPKGFLFDKEELVQLWMAQNFIQAGRTELIEDVGGQYFDYLLQLSLFQYSHFDHKSKRLKYTMADHIQQFAQSVGGETCIVKIGSPCNNSVTTHIRHSSLVGHPFASTNSSGQSSSDQNATFETIYNFKWLYTLLITEPLGKVVPGLVAKKLKLLRALDLSNSGVSEIPESIGGLKHLRYLQLRNTSIKRLPKSVGELYNLQTLGLGNCCHLQELPKHTKRLHQLRHLDLHLDDDSPLKHPQAYRLRSMPPNIGELTHLQTLSRFVVSRKKIFSRENRCGIGELQNLDNLYGELRISNLHLIPNETEAMDAKLNCKKHLSQLELRWNDGISSSHPHDEKVENKVIQALEPHPNLKELKIIDYRGASFPTWITGKSDFGNLVTLVLKDCSRTEVLPPLGHLPKLKDLHIEGMYGVTVVDCVFCGHTTRKFPALEKLHFERMPNLMVWRGDENCNLPSLRKLVIKECIKLCQLNHRLPLNCLEELEIESCGSLSSLPAYGLSTSLQFLSINDCPALGKRFGDKQGEDWRKIAHIASVWIDGQEVASASHSAGF